MTYQRVPEVAVRRLLVYLRVLRWLEAKGRTVVSSADLARLAGHSAAIVRKDLSWFGNFGTRGMGYDVTVLNRGIQDVLGLTSSPPRVVLAGAGHLGSALARYIRDKQDVLDLLAIFDTDPARVGRHVAGVQVLPAASMVETVRALRADIGIIAVPAGEARMVLEGLVSANVNVFLNFAPVSLRVEGKGCVIKNIDLQTELASLAYYIKDTPVARGVG